MQCDDGRACLIVASGTCKVVAEGLARVQGESGHQISIHAHGRAVLSRHQIDLIWTAEVAFDCDVLIAGDGNRDDLIAHHVPACSIEHRIVAYGHRDGVVACDQCARRVTWAVGCACPHPISFARIEGEAKGNASGMSIEILRGYHRYLGSICCRDYVDACGGLREVIGEVVLKGCVKLGAQSGISFQREDIRVQRMIHFVVDGDRSSGNNAQSFSQNLVAGFVFDNPKPRGQVQCGRASGGDRDVLNGKTGIRRLIDGYLSGFIQSRKPQ